jgi:N-acetylmuramoyl-L-alanine amidase
VKLNKIIIYIIILYICLFFSISFCNGGLREEFSVAIDIGHSKGHGGAISAHGISEYDYNREVASLLLSKLIKLGFIKSFIINENGEDITLIERANQANKRKANLLISIHHDSVQPIYLLSWRYNGMNLFYCDLYKGYSIFISDENDNFNNNLRFAELLGSELLNRGFHPSLHHAEHIKGENRKLINKEKAIYEFNKLVILKNANMPAVLLECGIIKNRGEEDSINYVYRKRLVSAITSAVINYYEKLR